MNDEFKKYDCMKIEENYRRLAIERYLCRKCNIETCQPEESNLIMDVIPPENDLVTILDLEQMIINTFEEDIVEKRCEGECDSQEFNRFYAVQQVPEVLIIVIKKFWYDQNMKMTRKLQTA